MAINLNHSIMEHKKEVKLDPTVNVDSLERGMVMVRSGFNAAGEALVAPSAGAAAEEVVGVLWLSETRQAESPILEELSVPAAAPYTLTLREVPTAVPGEVSAYDATTLASITVVSGTSPGAGEIAIDAANKLVTAHSALAGDDIVIMYRFAISAAELERRAGRRSVNQGAEGLYGQVTIVYGNCTLFLSNFDTEDAFQLAASVDVLSGADGKLSLDGSGTSFARKVQRPTMLLTPGLEQAFVGIECNLPGI